MYLVDAGTRVVTSPSDLTTWAGCEWSFLRRFDTLLGRAEPLAEAADAMLERTARLGDEHELRHLEQLRRECAAAGTELVEFERPDREHYAEAADAAVDAMRRGVEVLFQATFHDESFIGFADFVQRHADGYEVYDTKLARRAKVPALLQCAAYAEQIAAAGIPVGPQVHLVLGDGSVSHHALADIAPVHRAQRDRLRRVLDDRLRAPEPLAWGDPRYPACGRCSVCAAEAESRRDLVLVAGMRLDQRAALLAAGIRTVDELAASEGAVPGVPATGLARVRAQARLQIESESSAPEGHGAPRFEVVDPGALAAIPAPDPGDLFFDFEGDPLHTEDGQRWGLDYLFGVVDAQGRFTAFWAHDLRAERQALLDFLAFVRERRERHPGLHIHHYAAYERTHLLSIAARHGVGVDEVDELLRAGVLVDLYPVVRKALVVGSPSYSIKKLEPLYMGVDVRDDAGVTNAADSITAYVEAVELVEHGDALEGRRRLEEIAEYNAYDCRSTLALRDWLLSLRPPSAAEPVLVEVEPPREVPPPDPVFVELSAQLEGVDVLDRTPDQTALALAAAAIDYHRREAKSFWQEHYERLRSPLDEWADTRDVVVVEGGRVLRDWSTPPGKRVLSRELLLVGTLAPGSRLREGGTPVLVYDEPLPPSVRSNGPGLRGASEKGTVIAIDDDARGVRVHLVETLPKGHDPHDVLPVALAPQAPPRAAPQPEAISEWGRSVLDALPAPADDPALDLLRRVPPRGGVVPVDGDDTVGAVVATLLGLDRSFLAVQGPPGTGKTFVGSNVVARLVREHGWRIGVVGQSHAVVENFLDAVVAKGVDGGRVAKRPRESVAGATVSSGGWTLLRDNNALAAFLDGPGATGGVVGGTAWTFANASAVERRSLDLLVIDEAGQFSLAPTIASSVSAQRLLLLGDPQQLPQVSQGTHPEPVETSALGWLAHGHDVLPPEFGYFLSRTYRMHPALTAPVSALSYEGALESRAPTRSLEGLAPGLHAVPVAHSGNTTSSPEETAAVVGIARSMLGRLWTDEHGERELTAADVIVVAPYNAQSALIRAALDDAGLHETTVGTVDLFQGREAVVSIVSLAASAASEIPRGLDFLLMPNRLNVAVSRAKWAAFLVHSPALAGALPSSVAGLAPLARFIELVEAGAPLASPLREMPRASTAPGVSRS